MTFIADVMLGKLAKWLRILGYDVVYDPSAEDDALVRQALAEDRVLLTRDTRLLQRRVLPRHLFIASDHWREQLAQVVGEFNLDTTSQRFTRCLECNALLIPIAKEEVRYRVPAHIFDAHDQFATCPACQKIFWAGSHLEKGEEMLEGLFE